MIEGRGGVITVPADSRAERVFPEPRHEGGGSQSGRRSAIQDELVRKRVYDPVLRALHAWNALLILGLLVTAEVSHRYGYSETGETLWRVHVWLGFGLILGVVARLTWGVTGPRYARLKDLWHPREWAEALRTRRWFAPPKRFGHHAEASVAYLAFYLTLLCMATSGLVLAALEQNMGPLVSWIDYRVEYLLVFKAPHRILENVILLYIAMHLSALFLHRLHHRIPIAQSMFNGYQYRRHQP